MTSSLVDIVRRVTGTNNLNSKLDDVEAALRGVSGRASSASKAPDAQIGAEKLIADPEALAKGVRLAIAASDPASFFKCEFNGSSVWLPTDTLRTMIHCISAADAQIYLWVETAHINWMIDRLDERGGASLFLDVGAATGAACIPVALKAKSSVKIVAFEPAMAAMKLLRATLDKNDIKGLTLVNAAVSANVGQVEFVEYDQDPTGNCPFLPEASSISYSGLQKANSHTISVDCVTLDSWYATRSQEHSRSFGAVVVKIDVEGFEGSVLSGAGKFITEARPHFSIDIHRRIDGDDTTEAECRGLLAKFNYRFEKMGHVLLATPA